MISSNRALRAGMVGGVLAVAATGLGIFLLAEQGARPVDRLSDPASARTIALGRAVYLDNCAVCHGTDLDGQPNWQTPLSSGRLPAPPHDAGGHTWHHPDEVLFDITKNGPAAIVGNDYESDMPGFEGILTDDQIGAVLAYIKSTWPERERTYQQERTRQWQSQD